MLLPVLLVSLLGLYLAVEERERSAANPTAQPWWRRTRKSLIRKRWHFLGTMGGIGIQLARGGDLPATLTLGVSALALILFIALHEATLELPRESKDA